jgi:phosphatidate cytidylyltransferase
MIKDIQTRLITAIFFTAWVLGSLVLHQWAYYSLFLIICFAASFELLRVEMKDRPTNQITLLAFIPVLLPLIAIFLHRGSHQLLTDATIAILGISYSIYLLLQINKPDRNPFAFPGGVLSCVLYVGIPMYAAICLSDIDGVFNWQLMIGLFALTWANDTGAYLVGSRIGKRPLAKQISPKKTIEGTLGGILFCLISAWIISLINHRLSMAQWLATGIIVGIAGVTGDLIESKFKRYYGIKDSGTFLPGHGGFLDRFDSLLYLLPFVYIYLLLL